MSDFDFSRRAVEEADELLTQLDEELNRLGVPAPAVQFRVEGASDLIDRQQAEQWIMESVDAGFARVGYVLEPLAGKFVVARLAAFRDADSDFHP